MGQFLSFLFNREVPTIKFVFVCCRRKVDQVDGDSGYETENGL